MIRIATFAAAAAVLVAAPAMAAESIHIPTAGKTAAQVNVEIRLAARKLCRKAVVGATFVQEELDRCTKQTVAAAITQSGDPALAAAAKLELAQR